MERGLELGQLQEDELMLAQPMSQSSRQRAGLNGVRCRVHGRVRTLGIRTDPCSPSETPSGTTNQQGVWALVCGLVQVTESLSKRGGKEVGKNPCNTGPYRQMEHGQGVKMQADGTSGSLPGLRLSRTKEGSEGGGERGNKEEAELRVLGVHWKD